MTNIQIAERHRDFLADLVDHTPSLGRSNGPTGKNIPSSNPILLLYALFDDYAQSAWTHWGWHKEDQTAPWRAEVITKSALHCQHILKERHCDDEWMLQIHLRHTDLRQALQDWYKRIDYMPERSFYEVGDSGEEFPAPPDLIYLIWVVLEAADKWALGGLVMFSSDSEEGKIAKEWQRTLTSMRINLSSRLREAQTGNPPEVKKRWWQR